MAKVFIDTLRQETERRRPAAVYINWNDVQVFGGWLSNKTGKRFRLPTEAEWEYVCRAGSTSVRFLGR